MDMETKVIKALPLEVLISLQQEIENEIALRQERENKEFYNKTFNEIPGISCRLYSSLRESFGPELKIKDLLDLNLSKSEILRLRNFGLKSYRELVYVLTEIGVPEENISFATNKRT